MSAEPYPQRHISIDDPLFPILVRLTAGKHPLVHATAESLLLQVEDRNDREACRETLNGPAGAYAIQMGLDAADKAARPYLVAAGECADRAEDQIALATKEAKAMKAVPNQVLADGVSNRQSQINEQFDHVEVDRELRRQADLEHRATPPPKWARWVLGPMLGGLEATGFTMPSMNVELTAIDPKTFVPWLLLSIGMALVHILFAPWVGEAWRDRRDAKRSAQRNTEIGFAQAHHPERVQHKEGSRQDLRNRSPRDDQVSRHNARLAALVAGYGALSIVLAGGIGTRLYLGSAAVAQGESATALLFLAVVLLVVGLCTFGLVYWYSRGSQFGDDLLAGAETAKESHDLAEAARARGYECVLDAEAERENGEVHLAHAKAEIADHARHTHDGLLLAASMLHVSDIARWQELEHLMWPVGNLRAKAIKSRLSGIEEALSEVRGELKESPFEEPKTLVSTYAGWAEQHDRETNTTFLPEVPGEPPKREPQSRVTKRRVLIVGSIAMGALVLGVTAWLLLAGATHAESAPRPSPSLTTHVAATASAHPSATPARTAVSFTEGVDYALRRSPATGKTVTWACGKAIIVRFAGQVPDGGDRLLSTVVNELSDSTGLDIIVGSPLRFPVSDPDDVPIGQITVSYLPKDVMAAVGSDNPLGLGAVRFDPDSGMANGGWIALRSDLAQARPTTTSGHAALLHEAGHALALLHASPSSGYPSVMKPTLDDTSSAEYGPADRYALDLVGCARR